MYGTSPGRLPAFVRAPVNSDAVRVLDLAESKRLEDLSLNRFPAMSGDRIDWSEVPGIEQLLYEDEESGVQLLQDVLRTRLTMSGRVVVFWGSLDIPSVWLPLDLVIAHAFEVQDTIPHFWVYAPEDGLFIEFMPDGLVTIAPVPR